MLLLFRGLRSTLRAFASPVCILTQEAERQNTDGGNRTKVDKAFRSTNGGRIGAMVGFYAIGNGNRPGVMDVDWLRFWE